MFCSGFTVSIDLIWCNNAVIGKKVKYYRVFDGTKENTPNKTDIQQIIRAKKYPDKDYLSGWKKPWQRPTLPYSCVQYHRRWEAWLLSSGWDQVWPSLYCHQENLFVVKESYSLIKNSAWRVSDSTYRKWCQATFLISVLALILRTTTLIKKKSDQANGPISMS